MEKSKLLGDEEAREILPGMPPSPPPPSSDGESPPPELPKRVGTVATVGILLYLIVVAILLAYSLVQFWPVLPASAIVEGSPPPVSIFGLSYDLTSEGRLLFTVIIAGAIGAMVHGLRSYAVYVGTRKLYWSWVVSYVLLPFIGASLALVFYLVVRGGLFATQAGVSATSPAGLAALAVLVGLFSDQATAKLKKVAEAVFERIKVGADDEHYAGEEDEDNEPPNAEGQAEPANITRTPTASSQ